MLEQILLISSILLWIVLLFTLFLVFALVRRLNKTGISRPTPKDGLKAGKQAPAFQAETLQGEPVTLASYAGRTTAFVFLSTRCGPCLEALPRYEALGPKAAQIGTDLVLVSVDEQEKTRLFAEEHNLRLPVIVAPREKNTFFNDYKISGTPGYCLIDEQGRVISAGHPSFDRGAWKELADAAEREARVPLEERR